MDNVLHDDFPCFIRIGKVCFRSATHALSVIEDRMIVYRAKFDHIQNLSLARALVDADDTLLNDDLRRVKYEVKPRLDFIQEMSRLGMKAVFNRIR